VSNPERAFVANTSFIGANQENVFFCNQKMKKIADFPEYNN